MGSEFLRFMSAEEIKLEMMHTQERVHDLQVAEIVVEWLSFATRKLI